jgi:hypothetical protein
MADKGLRQSGSFYELIAVEVLGGIADITASPANEPGALRRPRRSTHASPRPTVMDAKYSHELVLTL